MPTPTDAHTALDYEPTLSELLSECFAIARQRARERAKDAQPTTAADHQAAEPTPNNGVPTNAPPQ